MKTKILTIAIGLLFPIIAIGQISVDYSFKNGAVEIEVTNNTTDLVSIVNELNIYDDGSAIDVKFLDKDGNILYKGRWGLGMAHWLRIYSKKSEKIRYSSLKELKVSSNDVKKIVLDVHLRYIAHAEPKGSKLKYFEEKKEIIVESTFCDPVTGKHERISADDIRDPVIIYK
jgi:hypothetical protein